MIVLKHFLNFIISLLKFIPYRLIEITALNFSAPQQGNDILIFKLDEIGDYILFRNFLPSIKNADKFKGRKIILCGNDAYKEIAEGFDSDYIDEFIWLNKKLFSDNYLYRFRFLKRINTLNLHSIINYTHSRKFYLDDTLVRSSRAAIKYGSRSDLSNSYQWQNKISDKYYTDLINTSDVRFEFYKNKSFLERITGEKTDLSKPLLEDVPEIDLNIPSGYIIVAPGGRFKHKRWNEEKFAEIARYLSDRFYIVLAGDKSDKKYRDSFQKCLPEFYDLTGKTSLIELIALVKKSNLIISNDSGIVHIAAAMNVRSVVLHNGTHYGRFLPYPEKMRIPQVVIHPPGIIKISPEERVDKFYYRSLEEINTITLDMVLNPIREMLN